MLQNAAHPSCLIHDMRNLMTVISLNCTMLEDSPVNERKMLLDEISQAVTFLDLLLKDLESNRRGSAPETGHTNMDQLLQQVSGFVAAIYPTVNVVRPKKIVNETLCIEPSDLLRCVLNLGVNAAEAAISSSASRPSVEFGVSSTVDRIQISVIDSGDGFGGNPKKYFAPLVSDRLSPSSNHRGLGLYVAQSIAESYGGSVTVQRHPGMTEVCINFPIDLIVGNPPTSTQLAMTTHSD